VIDIVGIQRRAEEIFALFDLAWSVDCAFATGDELRELREKGWPASLEYLGERQVRIAIDEEYFRGRPNELMPMLYHEAGHIILGPWSISGVFQTGLPLEEIQAGHIAYACSKLETGEIALAPEDRQKFGVVLDTAYRLTRLEENNWTVRVVWESPVQLGHKDIPAFAYSVYYQDCAHLAVLSARQIDLWIDPGYVEQNKGCLPNLVLRELWRVVLNPYSPPNRSSIQEKQLDHIMAAMVKLGWGRNKEGQS